MTASAFELLVLHSVRLKGMADDAAVAHRFALDPAATREALLDDEAHGWVTWSEFAGTGGWSLTERGRAENERRLAGELAETGAGQPIRAAHEAFLPLNGRLRQACTDWQLRPAAGAPLAVNDHTDARWDARVVAELDAIGRALAPVAARLATALDRFDGYDRRFAAALRQVHAGDAGAVDRTGADSCHTVWFELHEDLVATLGLTRAG